MLEERLIEMIKIADKQQEEIERLNKERSKTYENGLNYFLELQEKNEEIERLNNIIKEVREYIENEDNQTKRGIYPNYWYEVKEKDILEILDKGE